MEYPRDLQVERSWWSVPRIYRVPMEAITACSLALWCCTVAPPSVHPGIVRGGDLILGFGFGNRHKNMIGFSMVAQDPQMAWGHGHDLLKRVLPPGPPTRAR